MIDLDRIMISAQEKAIKTLTSNSVISVGKEIAEPSEVNVQRAQMEYALELLEQYHKALQKELSKYQIEI